MLRYIVITPAYNEEKNIERTIQSVLKQSILPLEWIIVDDGSTDNTAKIVKHYSNLHSWIKYYHFNNEEVPFGEHVHHNFYRGFKKIIASSWELVVKLDADLEIDRADFFAFQIKKMCDDPHLGICSGITYSIQGHKKCVTKGRPYWRTGGAMKVYRRSCLEQIGGIKPIYGWDGLDEYEAMFYGWKTRTFFDLEVNHLGKERALNREQVVKKAAAKGRSLYLRGYPIEFVLLKGLAYTKKSLKHGLSFYKGFFEAFLNRETRCVGKQEMAFFRKLQYKRVLDKFTKSELL